MATAATTAATATVRDDRAAAAGSEEMVALLKVVDIWTKAIQESFIRASRSSYSAPRATQSRLLQEMQYSALQKVLWANVSREEKHLLAARALEQLSPADVSAKTVALLISHYKTDAVSSALRNMGSKNIVDDQEKIRILLAIVTVDPTDDNIAYFLGQLQTLSGDLFLCISDIARNELLKRKDNTQSAHIAKELLKLLARYVARTSDFPCVEVGLGYPIIEIVSHCPSVEVALFGLETLHTQLTATISSVI